MPPNSAELRRLADVWRRRGNAAKALQLERLAAQAFAAETGTESLRDGTAIGDATAVRPRAPLAPVTPSIRGLPETGAEHTERARARGGELLDQMVRIERDVPKDLSLADPALTLRPELEAASREGVGGVLGAQDSLDTDRFKRVSAAPAAEATGRGYTAPPLPQASIGRVESPNRGTLAANALAEFQMRQQAAYGFQTGDPTAPTLQAQADQLREQTLLIRRGDPGYGAVGRVGASALDAGLRMTGVSQDPAAAMRERAILEGGGAIGREQTEGYGEGMDPVVLGKHTGLPETVGGLAGAGAALTAGGGLLGVERAAGRGIVEALAARRGTAGIAAQLGKFATTEGVVPGAAREALEFAIPGAASEASVAAQEGRDPLEAAGESAAQNAVMGAPFGAAGPALKALKGTGVVQSAVEALEARRANANAKAATSHAIDVQRGDVPVVDPATKRETYMNPEPVAKLAQRERDLAVARDPALTPDSRRPSSPGSTGPERLTSATIRLPNGHVYGAATHTDAYFQAATAGEFGAEVQRIATDPEGDVGTVLEHVDPRKVEEGFSTTRRPHVSRQRAYSISEDGDPSGGNALIGEDIDTRDHPEFGRANLGRLDQPSRGPVPAAEEARAFLAEQRKRSIRDALREKRARAQQQYLPTGEPVAAGETFSPDEAAVIRARTGVDVLPARPPETIEARRAAARGETLPTPNLAAERAALDEALSPEARRQAALIANRRRPGTAPVEGPAEAPPFAAREPSGEQGRRPINRELQQTARDYNESIGLPDPTGHPYVEVDPSRARKIADVYDKAESTPNDPETKAAYRAFVEETKAQAEALQKAGVRFESVSENPYENSEQMMADVAKRGVLKVYKTPPEDFHPLMTAEENDLFRGVHDAIAHAVHGNQFGPRGEENAWAAHARMYSPLARRAMTTETRGQNSWVNFGPNSHLPIAERPFAKQKVFLMPEEFTRLPEEGDVSRGTGRAGAFGRVTRKLAKQYGPAAGLLAAANATDDEKTKNALAFGAVALATHRIAPEALDLARQEIAKGRSVMRSPREWAETVADHIDKPAQEAYFRALQEMQGTVNRNHLSGSEAALAFDKAFEAAKSSAPAAGSLGERLTAAAKLHPGDKVSTEEWRRRLEAEIPDAPEKFWRRWQGEFTTSRPSRVDVIDAIAAASAPERFFSRLERHLETMPIRKGKAPESSDKMPAADWIAKLRGGGDFAKSEFEATILPMLEEAKASKLQLTRADVLQRFEDGRIRVSEHRKVEDGGDEKESLDTLRYHVRQREAELRDAEGLAEQARIRSTQPPEEALDDPERGLAKALAILPFDQIAAAHETLWPVLVDGFRRMTETPRDNTRAGENLFDVAHEVMQSAVDAIKPFDPGPVPETAALMRQAGWKVEVDRLETPDQPGGFAYYRITRPDGSVVPGEFWDYAPKGEGSEHYNRRIEDAMFREGAEAHARPYRRLRDRVRGLVEAREEALRNIDYYRERAIEVQGRVEEAKAAVSEREAAEAWNASFGVEKGVPGEKDAGETKYDTYQRVPGIGRNYREVLVSLDEFGAKEPEADFTEGHFSEEVPNDIGHFRAEDVDVRPELPNPPREAAIGKLRAAQAEFAKTVAEFNRASEAGDTAEAARARETARKQKHAIDDLEGRLPETPSRFDPAVPKRKGLNVFEAQTDWVQKANKRKGTGANGQRGEPRGFQRKVTGRAPEEQARLDQALAAVDLEKGRAFVAYDDARRAENAPHKEHELAHRALRTELANRARLASSEDEASVWAQALNEMPPYANPDVSHQALVDPRGAEAWPDYQVVKELPEGQAVITTSKRALKASEERAALHKVYNEAAHRFNEAERAAATVENPYGLPDTPFRETKDALGVLVGKALHEVARESEGYDHLLWSTSMNRHLLASLDKDPAEITYDKAIPSLVRKSLERLGFKNVPITQVTLGGYEHWKVDVTPEMKAAIRKAGVPLLGLIAAAALPSDAEAQDGSTDDEAANLRTFLATAAGAAAILAVMKRRDGEFSFRRWLGAHPAARQVVDRAETVFRSERSGRGRPSGLPREGAGESYRAPVDAGKDPRLVNRAKFDLDPAGQEELDRAVEKLVAEGKADKKRVTWEETKQVASDLGLDPDAIMRREGRLTGAELLAMRDLVSHNADIMADVAKQIRDPRTADEVKAELRARMAQLAQRNEHFLARFIKERSQTGRDLNALKILARRHLEPASWLEHARRLKGVELSQAEIDEVTRLSREKNRGGLVQYVSALRVSSPLDKFLTWWKAGLLTAPTTHLANVTGNAAMMAMETAKDIPASAIDAIIGAVRSGWDTGSLANGRRYRGKAASLHGSTVDQFRGLGRGFQAARKVFDTGIRPEDAEKWDIRHTTYKNKFLQAYTDLVFNSLSAEDQVFRGAALGRSLAEHARLSLDRQGVPRGTPEYGKALADLMANPPDALAAKAIEDAAFATFNNDNPAARWMGAHRREFKDAPIGRTVIGMTIPFVKTPTNVALRTLDYTPAGLFIGAYRGFRKGGFEGQKEFADNLGRSMTGSMFMMLGWQMAAEGRATGASPSSANERATWEARGVLPNAILTEGGNWVQLGRITPAGLLIALGAQMHAIHGRSDSNAETLGKSVGAFGRTMVDQSFLRGVSSLIDAASEPERRGGAWLETQLGSLVPFSALSGRIARGMDDRERAIDSPLAAFENKVPGLRNSLPARVDATGEPVPIAGGSTAERIARSTLDPFASRPDRTTPALAEMDRVGVPFALPSRDVPDPSRKSGTRPRTETERRHWLTEVGPAARQAMERLIDLPAYKAVPDPLKRRIMESVRGRVTSEGNARVDEGKNEKTLTEQLVQSAVESVALDLENDRERAAVQRVLTAMRSGSALPPGTQVGTVRRAIGEVRSDAVNGVLREPAEQAVARAEASANPEGELSALAMAPGLVGSLARRRLAVLRMVQDTSTPRTP